MSALLRLVPQKCQGSVSLRYAAFGRYCAPASILGQRGESPLMADALRPLTVCNCVAARRGGEQQEVSNQSVAKANPIRPCHPASLQ